VAKLTKKNEVFCEEYLIDLNATQAAIRAAIPWNPPEVSE
jgi:phage terminase small subunit